LYVSEINNNDTLQSVIMALTEKERVSFQVKSGKEIKMDHLDSGLPIIQCTFYKLSKTIAFVLLQVQTIETE